MAEEWDHVSDRDAVQKRSIVMMTLLAGATIDDGIRKFAGSCLSDPGGGVHYSGEFANALFDKCTAPAATRLARWPAVLAEIAATEKVEELVETVSIVRLAEAAGARAYGSRLPAEP